MPKSLSREQNPLSHSRKCGWNAKATHVFLPLFIGGGIYLFVRERDNVLFSLINTVVPMELIPRMHFLDKNFLANSLPDGLWTYAATFWMLQINGKESPITKLPISLAVLSEFGQQLKLMPGTFDPIDLIFYYLGYLLAVLASNDKTDFTIPSRVVVSHSPSVYEHPIEVRKSLESKKG